MDLNEWMAMIGKMKPADAHLYYPGGDSNLFWQTVRESPAYARDMNEIRAEGERLLQNRIPELSYSLFSIFRKTGSRMEYENEYFERRRRLNTFALLSLLDPENVQMEEELQNIIWAICDEYTWCLPAHLGEQDQDRAIDLFAAETGFTLSELSCLLQGRLPSLLQLRIKTEVKKRLFEPFLHHGPYHWETATTNWSAVCAGSIGAAALLLLEDNSSLGAILQRVEASFSCYLSGFGEDGACVEGLGYWNYGFGYYVYFAELLFQRTQGLIDWFTDEKLRNIAMFQQKCYLGGSAVANFSDALPHVKVQLGLSHYLARRYREVEKPPFSLRADYRDDHCSRWAHAFRNLLWRDHTNFAETKEDWGAASYYLPDAKWMVSRHLSPEGVYGFCAKGGHNGEPHNHNDIGQFMLSFDGEAFVTDLGSGEYNADYFGAGRYLYDCNGSQGHSVPIVDGNFQAEGEQHAAVVLEAVPGESFDVLRLDLTAAYECPGLKTLTRSLIWNKVDLPILELRDEYQFSFLPQKLVERIVTKIEPFAVRPGELILTGKGKRSLKIHFDAEKLEPMWEIRSFRNHFGVEESWYSLDFVVRQHECVLQIALKFEFV